METLFRVHDSPVPTQTFFEFFGSSAIAPIDCTGCSSNTGRYRVPLSSDFQTPPLAAATKSVILPDGSRVPAIAEIRPLIVAEPMLRAPRPEMVAELNGASSAREGIGQRSRNEIDARTRTPKGLRSKCKKTLDCPCESFCGAPSSSRFGSLRVFIYRWWTEKVTWKPGSEILRHPPARWLRSCRL